jgi:hypothetical protein
MRGIVVAVLVFVLALLGPSVLERFVKDVPEYVWRWGATLLVAVAILIALLSDPFYTWLRAFRAHPIGSTVIIGMSGGLMLSAFWFFVIVGFPLSKSYLADKPAKESSDATVAPNASPESSGLLTVHELYMKDFPNLLKFGMEKELRSGDGNNTIKIHFQVHMDFDAKSKFISFYIPASPLTFDVFRSMPNLFQGLLDESDKVSASAQIPGNSAMDDSRELVFTKKVFAYYEESLTLEQLGQLEGLYKSNGFSIQFRGMNYAVTRMLQSQATPKRSQ